ncbi:MAG: hypothetical protein LBP94_07325 [Zoogloeaceae bacterium]|nr:hypothetical protein [Zoogloeaceae bacterium]
MRELDSLGLTRILIQQPPQNEDWRAINDRLQRASQGSGFRGQDSGFSA